MLIKLHSQATPTPKIRAAIQSSDEPAWVLAERHGTTEAILEANRGLAKQPMILPEGLVLTLPDLDEAEPIRTVKLYD